jgi:flagellar basal-body rod protein FlgB
MSKMSVVEFLEAGLKAEALRQRTIANNVANLQTPGYRRLDVKFEQQLAKAMESDSDIEPDELQAQLYQPKNTAVKPDGNDVSLDVEVGELVKNRIRHKAFIRLLNKKYSQIDQAINIR